jgi:hypothetical protein
MEGLRHSVYIRADGYNVLAARPIESAQNLPPAVQKKIVCGSSLLTITWRTAPAFGRDRQGKVVIISVDVMTTTTYGLSVDTSQ